MPSWKKMCEELQIPDEIMQLEDAISQHQALIESVSQVYTEVPVECFFSSLYLILLNLFVGKSLPVN